MPPSRDIAAQIVARWLKSGDFPNRIISSVVEDRAFIMELVYGVVRWKRMLEWVAAQRVHHMPEPELRALIFVGLYQILKMTDVEHYAAVSETVEAVKTRFSQKQADFVNALLRTVLREKNHIIQTLQDQPLGLQQSHPDVLIERWVRCFGKEATQRLCEWNNSRPEVMIHVNRLKISPDHYVTMLRSAGIEIAEPPPASAVGWAIPHGIKVETLPGYEEGLFLVIDPSAVASVEQLNPQPGECVLDACAAPGGKTFLIAEQMKGQGRLVAMDLHNDRLAVLLENLRRLGCADFVEVVQGNAMNVTDEVKLSIQRTGLLLRNSCYSAKWRFATKHEPEPYPPSPLYPIASEGRLAILTRHSPPRRTTPVPPRAASYAVVALATEAKKHGAPWRRRVGGPFDRILVDVPCTNTGVIRRKPDVRWRFSESRLARMTRTQRAMLERLSELLKPGGSMVYSTCSLEREENEDIIAVFLSAHSEFRLAGEHKLFPPVARTDGAYAALLQRSA